MPALISILIFFTVLLSFLANPAPASLEISDIILPGLSIIIALLSFAVSPGYKLYREEKNLLLAIIFYLTYLLLSLLSGLLNGVPLLNVLRSIGPYIGFFPLLFTGFIPAKRIPPQRIAIILITVGLLQACYLFYLYLSHTGNINNTNAVLRYRITLMDPRTTLPLLLALAILPISFILKTNPVKKQGNLSIYLVITSIMIGLYAAVITLTRAIVLSIIVGWVVFFIFHFYFLKQTSPEFLPIYLRKCLTWVSTLFFVLIILSFIPSIHLIETGLLTRFFDHTASGAHTDYSDGRLLEEWLPALKTWLASGWINIFFGIGAGNAFITPSGEERTYIHNLSIYTLVYGGIFGFISCLWLYYSLFKTMIVRAFQSRNSTYIVFAALLASLFFYGQLFAVHKGFAFNVMLFLMIGLAFSQPVLQKRND